MKTFIVTWYREDITSEGKSIMIVNADSIEWAEIIAKENGAVGECFEIKEIDTIQKGIVFKYID